MYGCMDLLINSKLCPKKVGVVAIYIFCIYPCNVIPSDRFENMKNMYYPDTVGLMHGCVRKYSYILKSGFHFSGV